MNETSRRVLLTCGVLVLVACVCVSLLAIGGGVVAWLTADRPAPQAVATAVPADTATPITRPTRPATVAPADAATPTPQPTRSGDEALPADVRAQMDEIESQVSTLRGLAILQPVRRTTLTRAELQQRVLDDFLKDYTPEEAHKDALVLSAFGLLPADYDLLALYQALYTEQVAGFYDDEEKAMYVVQDADFTGVERLTYAHEFVHALQDQHFDPRGRMNYTDEACDADSERCAAIQALMEGDASYFETQWLYRYATSRDIRDLQRFYQDYSSPVYDSAPAFLQMDFLFPYERGQQFVEFLYNRDGLPGIDAAYANPPVSTEQILHPERYPQDTPQQVTLPDLLPTLGDGWEMTDQDVLGEWFTYLVLAQGDDPRARLADEVAQPAAEGWGGDAYAVYHHAQSGQTVLVVDMRWDTAADAAEFAQAFRTYADRRWGAGDGAHWHTADADVRLQVQDARTVWVLAPDAPTAQALLEALP